MMHQSEQRIEGQSQRNRLPLLLSLLVVLLAAFLCHPRGVLEWDEGEFFRAIHHFKIAEGYPHPPGFPLYVVLGQGLFRLLGDELTALWIPSLLGGAMAFLGIYRLALWLHGERRLALLSGLAFGFLPPQWFFSAVPMSDGISNGIAYLGLSFLATAWSGRNLKQSLLAGLLCGLSLSLRPATLFFLFAPWLIFALLSLRRGKRGLLLAFTTLVLGGLPGLWILIDNLGGIDELREVFSTYYAAVGSKDHILASIRNEGPLRVLKFWILWPFGSAVTGMVLQALFFTGLIPLLRGPLARKSLGVLIAILPYAAFALVKMNFLWASRYGLPILLVYFLLLPPMLKHLLASRLGPKAPSLACALWILVSALWMAPVIRQIRSTDPPPEQALRFWRERTKHHPSILIASSDLGGHIPSLLWDQPSILDWGRPLGQPWLGRTTHLLEAFPGKNWGGMKNHDKGWSGPILFHASWDGEKLKHLSRPRFSRIWVSDESRRAIPWTGWFSPKERGTLPGRKAVSLLLPPNLPGKRLLLLQLRLTPLPGGGTQESIPLLVELLEDWRVPDGGGKKILEAELGSEHWKTIQIPYTGTRSKVLGIRLSLQDPRRAAEDVSLLARGGEVRKR
ncbi:MAG TPA: DUF2723 domain-containing protein [Planctomycetes bacterium]|nr:DUF2723 domain-containing protein [Planctomycetota bacterium]